MVHRDLKPANLLVDADGKVSIADFDVAAVDGLSATTTVEAFSPPHAAPERFAGSVDVGVAADIWSLGSTLFTLADGRPPFGTAVSDGGLAGLTDRVRAESPRHSERLDAHRALYEVILGAIEKDPEDRWPSAEAFGDALADVYVEAHTANADSTPLAHVAEARATGPSGDDTDLTIDPNLQAARLRAAALASSPAVYPAPLLQERGGERRVPSMLLIALLVSAAVAVAIVLAVR